MGAITARLGLAATALWMAGVTATAAAQTPPATADAAATPQVTVEAKALDRQAHSFVMNVTGASGFFMDESVQLWRRPVCPLVAGLPRQQGQWVFDHLEAVFASVGVLRGPQGCHPNFFFIVTNDPASVLQGAWKRNWHLFGDASPTLVNDFIRTSRPVRVWYNTIPEGGDGPAAPGQSIPALLADPLISQSAFGAVPSVEHDGNGARTHYVWFHDLLAVVAIVNPAQLRGFNWTQVADYVAMTGLTPVAPDVDVGDVPSILRLFTPMAGSKPAGLSDWDRTFLKELYSTDSTLIAQRFEVSHRMARDLQNQGH